MTKKHDRPDYGAATPEDLARACSDLRPSA